MAPLIVPSVSSVLLVSLPLLLLVSLQPLNVYAQPGPQPPQVHWPQRFTVTFNETSYLPVRRKTEGLWFYDAAAGLEVVARTNGRGDRWCGSIHPFTNTPCTHLVTGGVRYLIFPDLGTCCTCCTADYGCGVLSPSWLDTARYEGPQHLNGMLVDKWRIAGLQSNNVYFQRGTGVPVEVDQIPNDYIFMHPDTFSTDPISADVFKIPSTCAELKRCPFFSFCTAFAPPFGFSSS